MFLIYVIELSSYVGCHRSLSCCLIGPHWATQNKISGGKGGFSRIQSENIFYYPIQISNKWSFTLFTFGPSFSPVQDNMKQMLYIKYV